MRSEIGELLDRGVLCRSVTQMGVVQLLPGMPPDKLSVIELLQILNGSGDSETPDFAKFDKLFDRMEMAVKESDFDVKVHEVGKE